jgi:NADPH:quinone reductase-like Zn-dependent oxidoreductase
MTPTARAVRFDHYGGREVLSVVDIPMPTASAGRVVVEVRAAGINPGRRPFARGCSTTSSRPPSPPARAPTWPAW